MQSRPTGKLKDLDIRRELHNVLAASHRDQPDTLILDELGLCQGRVRVDMAVINGSISGFEIKSESDTLTRLPGQEMLYSRILDQVVLVAARHHLDQVYDIVPDWWGLWIAQKETGAVGFEQVRAPRQNPSPSAESVVQLLWRDEALDLLTRAGVTGVQSKSRRVLWERLLEAYPFAQLHDEVCRAMKGRERWRLAE